MIRSEVKACRTITCMYHVPSFKEGKRDNTQGMTGDTGSGGEKTYSVGTVRIDLWVGVLRFLDSGSQGVCKCRRNDCPLYVCVLKKMAVQVHYTKLKKGAIKESVEVRVVELTVRGTVAV